MWFLALLHKCFIYQPKSRLINYLHPRLSSCACTHILSWTVTLTIECSAYMFAHVMGGLHAYNYVYIIFQCLLLVGMVTEQYHSTVTFDLEQDVVSEILHDYSIKFCIVHHLVCLRICVHAHPLNNMQGHYLSYYSGSSECCACTYIHVHLSSSEFNMASLHSYIIHK